MHAVTGTILGVEQSKGGGSGYETTLWTELNKYFDKKLVILGGFYLRSSNHSNTIFWKSFRQNTKNKVLKEASGLLVNIN